MSKETQSSRSSEANGSASALAPLWKWVMHLSGDECVTIHRDNDLGLQRESTMKRHPLTMALSRPRIRYYKDGCKKGFRTEAELVAHLNQRHNAKMRDGRPVTETTNKTEKTNDE